MFVIPGVVAYTCWLYVFAVMAEERCGIGESFSRSWRLVWKHGFWSHLLFGIVVALLEGLCGSVRMVPLVGVIIFSILSPISWLAVCASYVRLKESSSAP